MKKVLNKKIICFLVVFSLVFPLCACGETKSYQKQVLAMDTIMTLTAYGKNAQKGLASAEATILALDTAVDPDIETSTTYAINHAEGEQVVISGQVADMLLCAKDIYEKTDGSYDLTIYPLVDRWGFNNGKYYIPTDEEIMMDLSRLCMDQLTISSFPTSGTYVVTLPTYGELSFASCAKGCASKYAIDAMRKSGVSSAIVSLGGNVQTLGLKPDGSSWIVGIVDPNNTTGYLATVSVGETAIVTSGPYQRYMPNNPKYHHIFSPKTGYPTSNSLKSVTIICEDGTTADCLSTAMFVLGESGALRYWKENGGFEMIMINSENQITATIGLQEKIDVKNENYTLRYYEG